MANQVITVSTNASQLAHALGDVYGDQIPFATALALTDVAFKVQRVEKSEMAKALTLRNKFSQGGIQVNAAEKSDWPATYAEVGIEERRSYLIDHVLAGKRQGGTHGKAILEQDSLRGSTGRVPAAKRPGAIIAAAKRAQQQAGLNRAFGARRGKDKRAPFIFFSRKWGNEVIAQRMTGSRYPLRIIYAFKRGVEIRREFEMDVIAAREAGRAYWPAFDRALRKAIASGKDKAERQASSSRDQLIDSGR